MVAMLRNAMQVSVEETECDLFESRVKTFLGEPEKLKLSVRINGRTIPLKKKSRRSGHFQSWLELSNDFVQKSICLDDHGNTTIPFEIDSNVPGVTPGFGVIVPLSRRGVSVISDIDDTIKVSLVTDRRKLLANTFLKEFEAVEGMAQTYRTWAKLGANFHYVSSSPWQLYDSLLKMRIEEGFPAGTFHLRNFLLRDQLLKKVLIIRRKGKVAAIKSIIKHLPERKFVLVGDSGEKDPEIYQKICAKYPGQIEGLFIRQLEQRPLDAERFERIRQAAPQVRCQSFDNASQLQNLASDIFERRATSGLV